jgi:hypothetical protein
MRQLRISVTYWLIGGGVVLIVVVGLLSGAIGAKEIGTGSLALLGTLLGALLAFRLNEERERTREHERRKAALNRAILILSQQWNAVANLQANYLNRFADPIQRALALPAANPPAHANLTHKLEDLEFLVSVSDPNLLARLLVEDDGFHQFITALRLRNEFYVTTVQPAVDREQLANRPTSEEELRSKLGPAVFDRAINEAATVYALASAAAAGLDKMADEMHVAAKTLYPDSKFVRLNPESADTTPGRDIPGG